MSDAIITLRNSTDTQELSSVSFGTVDKGSTSEEITIRIWNNYGGASPVSDAENCSLVVKTFTGVDEGDEVHNGQEIVSEKMVQAKCTSRGDTEFIAIGGATTLPVGYTTGSRVLKGAISDPNEQVSTVVLKMVVPADASASSINFKLFLSKT